jgi:hypothetical protein
VFLLSFKTFKFSFLFSTDDNSLLFFLLSIFPKGNEVLNAFELRFCTDWWIKLVQLCLQSVVVHRWGCLCVFSFIASHHNFVSFLNLKAWKKLTFLIESLQTCDFHAHWLLIEFFKTYLLHWSDFVGFIDSLLEAFWWTGRRSLCLYWRLRLEWLDDRSTDLLWLSSCFQSCSCSFFDFELANEFHIR